MSEVKNSTTDIDNNVQEETKPSQSPVATPRKRMTRAEKALMESEQLLKSLGVSMESGRQTRSSRRGPAVESPKPEPVKRKPPASTPRRTKKAKISESDQTDATNHVEESKPDEAQQIAPAQTTEEASKEPEPVVEEPPIEKEPEPEVAPSQPMEVDTPPIESTPPVVNAPIASEPKPVEIVEEPPSPPKPVAEVSSQETVQSESVTDALEAADADTTTAAIAIESEPIVDEAAPSPPATNDSEPIELQSSPDDIEAIEPVVTNSQATISQSNDIVELESSNDADAPSKVHEIDSLDLELINSDSSLSAHDVQFNDVPATQPTSTVAAEPPAASQPIEIIDASAPTNDSVYINDSPPTVVESTNNQTPPIEIPEKLCTITVGSPVQDTISTTTTSSSSDNLMSQQSNITTA